MIRGLIDREIKLKSWTYSRVDTVKYDKLELFKRVGIDWLALGIEAGSKLVRADVSKGRFQEINIKSTIDQIRKSGINVIANYIFGLPEDNWQTMQETLDLAIELNTEMANLYPCHALPGSSIYQTAKARGWKLPNTYDEYAFLGYECNPLPTKYLSAKEVLWFRDYAWKKYFDRKDYLSMVESKFGAEERKNIESLLKVKLERRLLKEYDGIDNIKKHTKYLSTPSHETMNLAH